MYIHDPIDNNKRGPFYLDLIKHTGAWSAHLYPSVASGQADSQYAYGGTAASRNVACQKAISEYIERQAYLELLGKLSGTFSSSGFAARPWMFSKALTRATTRSAAYLEACERLMVPYWWNSPDIRFEHVNIPKRDFRRVLPTVHLLDLEDAFKSISVVKISASQNIITIVLIGYLPVSGVVVGIAAGKSWQYYKTVFRASIELMRHHRIACPTTSGMKNNPPSIYAKKIIFLASGVLDQRIDQRLSRGGYRRFCLPNLTYDKEVKHRNSKSHYVHRCQLDGQIDIFSSLDNIAV